MKTRILLSVLLTVMIFGAIAQNPSVTLTFSADNNSQQLSLDSVLIENMTQGVDTTLYAPDSVLVLDYISGMEEFNTFNSYGFSLSQNYPNPMEGKTTVNLQLSESNLVLISISNVMGMELLNRKFQLGQGIHSFNFYPGGESFYLLTVHVNEQRQAIKMFNSSSHSLASGYCMLQHNGQNNTITEVFKTGNAVNNFMFNPGDHLKLTAFTSLGEQVITSVPSEDQTYYFNFTGDPCPGTPTVNDIDGNIYNTVFIGSQCWMKENLRTTTYRNGTPIPNVPDPFYWENSAEGAYVWYDNDFAWKEKYGALYNWLAISDTSRLCPDGWHVPTDDEWTMLTDFIGGTGSLHGEVLKSCRQENSPYGGSCNTDQHPRWSFYSNGIYGTNDYGFSGLPGGSRVFDGFFQSQGTAGLWWSSTEHLSIYAWGRSLAYFQDDVVVNLAKLRNGYSVRCLRNN